MGQKINPIALRVGISQLSNNIWYSQQDYGRLAYQTILMESYVKLICKSLVYASGRFVYRALPKQKEIFFCYSKLIVNKPQNKESTQNRAINAYSLDKLFANSNIPYRSSKKFVLLFLLILFKLSNSVSSTQKIIKSVMCLLFVIPKLISSNNKNTLSVSCLFEKNLSENVSFFPLPFTNSTISAQLLADELSILIERKQHFKFAANQLLKKIKKNPSIKGARISCAGRLNGAEMARTEYIKYGQTSLQTITAQIDYASSDAKTKYGLIGIKIWVCYSKTKKETL